MGVFKFQLPSQDLARLRPHLRKAYVTGQDRTPSRLDVELRSGVLVCHRDTNESGRLFVPWLVEGLGVLIIGTATLGERFEPYDLAVELARGRLNEVRNQLADWVQMGLRTTPELDRLLAESRRSFVTAVVARDAPDLSHAAAQASLAAACKAGNLLVEAYTRQVLHNRLSATPKLPTFLGGVLAGDPKVSAWANEAGPFFNAAQLPCSWKAIAPTEGKYRWDQLDAQLAWCRKHRLAIQAGPVLEFTRRRPARLVLALGRGLRLHPRVRRGLRPPGHDALPGQGPGLAPRPSRRRRATSSASPRRSRSG